MINSNSKRTKCTTVGAILTEAIMIKIWILIVDKLYFFNSIVL